MAANYYTLVAGLKEYSRDTGYKGFDARTIVEEIRGELNRKDNGYLELFYTYYDIENLVNALSGRSLFSALGNFSREELEQEMKVPSRLPAFVAEILDAYAHPDDPQYDDIDRTEDIGRTLFAAYYAQCARSHNRFIRKWYEFDRNLRNLTAAVTARRLGIPVGDVIVGDGDVAENLVRSPAADFGLKGELEYADRVVAAVAEQDNLLEKENRIDMIRWEMSDELTVFDYFDINAILAYLVKVGIVHRWASLDPVVGREMFERLVATMSGEEAGKESEAEKTEEKTIKNEI